MSDYKYLLARSYRELAGVFMDVPDHLLPMPERHFTLCPDTSHAESAFQNFMRMSSQAFFEKMTRDLPPDTIMVCDIDDSAQAATISMASRIHHQDALTMRDLRFLQQGPTRIVARGQLTIEESITCPAIAEQPISLRGHGLGAVYNDNLINACTDAQFHTMVMQAMDDGRIAWTKMGFGLAENMNATFHQFRQLMLNDMRHIRSSVTEDTYEAFLHIMADLPAVALDDKIYDLRANKKILNLAGSYNGMPVGEYLLRQIPNIPLQLNLYNKNNAYIEDYAPKAEQKRDNLRQFYNQMQVTP